MDTLSIPLSISTPLTDPQVDAFLPRDPAMLLGFSEDQLLGLPCCTGTSDNGAHSCSSCSSSHTLPWLLHGDLRSHNVHFTLPPEPSGLPSPQLAAAADGRGSTAVPLGGCDVCVLDFADAGHGDPMYDLVVLIGGCFSADAALARACWAAYKADVDVQALWPHYHRVSDPVAAVDLVDPVDPVDPVGGSHQQPQQQPRVSLSYVAMCYCLLLEEDVVLERVCSGGVAGGQSSTGCGLIAELQHAIWGFLDEQ